MIKRLKHEWPVGLLIVLFVVQIHVFNHWVDLTQLYFWRRTFFNLGLGALLFGPALLFNRRAYRYLYLLAVQLLITVIFTSQYLFFAYSGSFLQASVIKYLGAAGDVAGTVKTLPIGPLFFFLAAVPAWAILLYLDRRERKPYSPKQKRALGGVLVLLFGVGLGIVTLLDFRKLHTIGNIFRNPFDNGALIKKVGIVGYGALDLRKYLATPHGISLAERQEIIDWAKSHPQEKTAGNYFGLAKGKNLVFVQSESFERFLIGKKVSGQEITPNLNRFAKDSLYFSNYYYLIGPGHTVDAEFTTLNSILPLQDRVIYFEYPKNHYQTLAGQLKTSGYETDALHANAGSFWNRNAAYPNQGYGQFYDSTDFEQVDKIGWGISDKAFFEQSVEKLARVKQPFFANLVSLTQHTPFDLPENLKTLEIDKSLGLDWIQEAYLQSAHYYDSAFGEFVNQMKVKGLYDKTVIALDGDHTAFLEKPDDANFAKFLGFKNGFDRVNFIQNTQVPLMVHLPGGELKGTIATPGSHLDIYPTLANLMGLKVPGSVLGHDLLNTKAPVAVSLRFNTKIVDAIETKDLLYISSESGSFDDSICINKKSNRAVNVHLCHDIYADVQEKLKISELAIRGNAINLLNNR